MALLFSEDGRGGEGGGMVGGYASGGRTNVCTCGADRVTGNRHEFWERLLWLWFFVFFGCMVHGYMGT